MANKLELTWVGKEKELKIEPRILIKNPTLSNTKHDENTENMLIHGDNLLALKALESKYAGKVKCIYIDPPYNTGNAFEYYNDNLEHSIWLNLMLPRIKLLYNLLKDGGSIWISIDDCEMHRLRLILDEVFSPSAFVADITYERSGSAGLGQGGLFVNTSEHILVYSKGAFQYNNILGNMSLSDPDNLIDLPNHHGRHTNAYKDAVLDKITEATKGIEPRTKEYTNALKNALIELKDKLISDPSFPYKK